MARALDQSEKETYQLVRFVYGDPANPTQLLYTDWNQAVPGGYVSVPTLEIELPANHGTFQATSMVITMEIADAFTQRAAQLLPHSPIFVQVDDVRKPTIAGASATQLTFYRGRVLQLIRNKDGKPNLLGFKCQTVKSRLDQALGIPCNSHCSFTLFGPGCRIAGLTQTPHQKNVVIASAVGKTATINTAAFTAPTSPGGNVDHFWDRGYLELDGLRISIRDWNISDPTQCHVRKTIPPEWVGQTVRAVPGCHKTIEDCREVWDNEEAAGHFGYGMQDYNPLFESPS